MMVLNGWTEGNGVDQQGRGGTIFWLSNRWMDGRIWNWNWNWEREEGNEVVRGRACCALTTHTLDVIIISLNA